MNCTAFSFAPHQGTIWEQIASIQRFKQLVGLLHFLRQFHHNASNFTQQPFQAKAMVRGFGGARGPTRDDLALQEGRRLARD